MTAMKQVASIATHNLIEFVDECIAKALAGWEFIPDHKPSQDLHMYTADMVRFPTLAELQADADELGKPSRADILAKARAAKAEKASANV
jgi:hypothetical protein